MAKELGDFLQHYKRETELFTVFREESGMIPRSFLKGQSTTGQIPGVCIFFGPEMSPPPLWKWYFSPFRDTLILTPNISFSPLFPNCFLIFYHFIYNFSLCFILFPVKFPPFYNPLFQSLPSIPIEKVPTADFYTCFSSKEEPVCVLATPFLNNTNSRRYSNLKVRLRVWSTEGATKKRPTNLLS